VIASWRCCKATDDRGVLVYFDPYLEDITIRQLTAPERADRLTGHVSVSALVEGEGQLSLLEEKTNGAS